MMNVLKEKKLDSFYEDEDGSYHML